MGSKLFAYHMKLSEFVSFWQRGQEVAVAYSLDMIIDMLISTPGKTNFGHASLEITIPGRRAFRIKYRPFLTFHSPGRFSNSHNSMASNTCSMCVINDEMMHHTPMCGLNVLTNLPVSEHVVLK
jgi:hypothetical protein